MNQSPRRVKASRGKASRVSKASAGNTDLVLRRLDAVIGLLLRQQTRESNLTLSEQIWLLHALGVDNPTIGAVVGRPANFVGAVTGRMPPNWTSTTKKQRGEDAKARHH
jgi:hypothetical protein